MDLFVLQSIWYFVICACVVFYTVLDGFDLGVGILHLCVKEDDSRRIFLNSIGPLWDGNAVWFVVIGGGLFAGFPDAYATLCSAMYTPFMILLAAIICRAVAIEFRSKMTPKLWRSFWDGLFSLASFMMAFLIGVILANLISGMPINRDGNFVGVFTDFFKPYSLLMGFTSVALFAMHGSLFLLMKTEGELHNQVRKLVGRAIGIFVIFYIALTITTIFQQPHMLDRLRAMPILFSVAALALLCIASIFREIKKNRDGRAFALSCASIVLLFSLFGLGTYPVLVRSSIHPIEYSLTFMNTGASYLTLKVLIIIAGIGVPLVLAYGFWIYKLFRGKVTIGPASY